MHSERLGMLLRRARGELAMGREQLARTARVSLRLVAEVERGQRPNVSLESTLNLLTLAGVTIVATTPSGATVEVRSALSAAVDRAARAAVRRRTWSGAHLQTRNAGTAPSGGRTSLERLAAVSQLSQQAYALAATGRRGRVAARRTPW